MQNLLAVMLGIIGVSVALLAGLIYVQSDQPSGPPPGSACAYEKGTLDSVIIPGFVHNRVPTQNDYFANARSLKSTECLPEEGSLFADLIDTVTLQNYQFESEEDARNAIRDMITFGDHTSTKLGTQDVEIITFEELNLVYIMMRRGTQIVNIVIDALETTGAEDLEILESVGEEIANTILGDR